jgi:hypothetical protein
VNENERLKAIPQLTDWRMQDDTVKAMIAAVLTAHGQPSVGHLARFNPDVFDELFEEAEAMVENDD